MSPISNASRLAEFGSGIGTDGAVFQVDNTNKRIGIGTTNPLGTLQVGTGVTVFGNSGIISATDVRADTFRGSGANLTSLPSAQLTGALPAISGSNLTGVVGVGTLNVRTNTVVVSGVSTFTGAVDANSTSNFADVVTVSDTTESTSSTSGALVVSGGVGIAKSLRVGTELHVGSNVTIGGTLTYEDVTNIDSVGLVTARAGVNVSGGQFLVGSGITMGIAGVATFSGTSDVHLKDNVQLKVGDSSDLNIYHDGTNSYVNNTGTGYLILQGNGSDDVSIRAVNGETGIAVKPNGGASKVEVYYDNSKKFETTNDGTVTTGVSTATGGLRINADGSASASHLALGASLDDLVMWHQNGNSYLVNNDGNLTLRSDGHVYIQDASGNTLADFNEDGPVELYHNANKKFETTNDGTVTTGIATASNVVASGQLGIGGAPADYQQLHITATDPRIRIESSGTNAAKIQFADSGSPDVGAIEYAHSDDSMRFNTASGERARITSAGNLGIGIVNPSEKLTVSSGNLAFIGGTNDAQYIKFGDSGDDDIGNIFYYHGNNNMVFTTNTSEKLRITSDGALGLNGTNYGTSGQVLTSGGSGSAPSWADAGGGATEVIQSWDFGANYGQSYFETSATGITTSSGFISYELIISGLQFVGGEAEKLAVRVYKSGGSLETGSNYKTYCRKSQFLSTSDENETANSVSTWELMGTNNQDREFWDGSIKWKNPGYTTGKTMPPFMRAEWYQQARFAHFDICQVNFGNTDYISGIRVYNNSDASVNLMSGRACLIGYKFV